MTLKKLYDSGIGDYEETHNRLLSDDFISSLISQYIEDKHMNELENALKQNDSKAAFLASHSLKGMHANLGFINLKELSSALCETIRNKKISKETIKLFKKLKKEHKKVIKIINKYKKSK